MSNMESDWFENEYNTGEFGKPHHYDHYIWLPQFAQPMGKQSSHEDCHWNGHCDAIDCDLSTKGSAWKFLVMNSVTHLWEYFNIASEAIPKVSSLFSGNDKTQFELYWDNVKKRAPQLNAQRHSYCTGCACHGC